jgi:signal transduction histidine kinase
VILKTVTHSIRHKLVLVVLAATFAALAVAGVALVIYDLRTYQQSGVDDLATQAQILGRASAPALAFDDPKAANEYLTLLRAKPNISAAAIYNIRGKLFASYRRGDAQDFNFPPIAELDNSRVEGDALVMFRRIVENNEILGTVYLRADYALFGRLADFLAILGAVMVMSLLVAFVMSAWLQSAVSKPILATAVVARQVMERRDFSLRAAKTTEDELGVLVDAFNDMLAEVERRADALEASNRSLEHEMAERRRAEDDLRALNIELERRVADRTAQLESANKELEGFSYSVSHDLRAPLRAVVGFSQMLIEDHAGQLDDECRRKLGVIKDEAQRMGVLIDELLAFSRLGRKEIQMAEVDMTALARTAFDSFSAQLNGVNVAFHLGSLPKGMGDRVLLGQVWANLIANAIKFSSKRERPFIEVSAISDDDEHVYFVRDNGAGFDPRYRAKLFGVFQRLHDSAEFPGTGVGLALVQRIVARHGGRVWAEGRPNEGASFYFTLPKE